MSLLSDIQTLAGVVSPLTGKAPLNEWRRNLHPASWRGVPFVTLGGQIRVGRRNAVHEYPFRDTVWVEDLGRAARRISVVGFYVPEKSGDESAIQWRERMIAACESPGDGQLVHVTLGALTVSLMDTSFEERWDRGRVIQVNFTFIESGKRTFPDNVTSTGDDTEAKAAALDAAASADFVTRVSATLTQGASVVNQAATSAARWARTAQNLANDATNLTNMVSSLPGMFGRYFGGANKGLSGITSGIQGVATTIQNLIAIGAVTRTQVGTAVARLSDAAARISSNNGVSTFATSGQGLAASVLAATSDPADSIRLLTTLATPTAALPTPGGAIGSAMSTMQSGIGDLFRRAAVVALSRASAKYQPSSSDDAVAIRTQVCDVLDAEILIAGNQGEDATYTAMRALRAAVVNDLTQRGAVLATLMTVQSNAPVPSLVLAQRLYRDSTRSDELIIESDAVHPAFMPTTFKALSQ